MEKVLLVIDMQNDFVTGALGSAQAVAVVEGIRRRVEEYQRENRTVLFTMDTHMDCEYREGRLTQEAARFPKHCIRDTPGWELVPALQPYAKADQITKSTFLAQDLAEQVRRSHGENVEFLLCGVCTDICVASNALALRAAFPHSRISVEAALCAGTTPENHDAALAVMGSCLIDIV